MSKKKPNIFERFQNWIFSLWDALVQNDDQWQWLRTELIRRTFTPLKSVSFVLFVFIALCALGGLGIWIEVLRYCYAQSPKDITALTTATLTFFPSIIGAATFQLILDRESEFDFEKILPAVSLSVLVFFIMADAALAYVSNFDKLMALRGGIFFSLASIYIWWLMNADSAIFREKPDPSVGGSTSATPIGGIPSDFNQ